MWGGGGTDNQRKIHLLNWETVCKPKKDGGLGLRSTRQANTAFMMKGLWELCTNQDSLWGSIVRNKYKCGASGMPKIEESKKGSNFWNGLSHNWKAFHKLLRWQMGNGLSIFFWNDNWIPGCDVLCKYSNTQIPNYDLTKSISHYTMYNGGWNFNLFEHLLPSWIVQKISEITPPLWWTMKMNFPGARILMVPFLLDRPIKVLLSIPPLLITSLIFSR